MLVEVFVDGGCRGNGQRKTGESACAAVIYKNRQKIAQFARGLGKRTNNEAEYEGIITGLLMCSMAELYDPIIYSDSAVAVNHINGKWFCSDNAMLPLLLSVRQIQEEFRFRVMQVPRNLVWEPDGLCNKFLDELEETRRRIPPKILPQTEDKT